MSDSKHTPGPWKTGGGSGDEDRYVIGPDGELIACVLPDNLDGWNLPHDYQANAHLIATAPELLKEAENIIMHRNQGNLHPKDFHRLESAIAKAKGESS